MIAQKKVMFMAMITTMLAVSLWVASTPPTALPSTPLTASAFEAGMDAPSLPASQRRHSPSRIALRCTRRVLLDSNVTSSTKNMLQPPVLPAQRRWLEEATETLKSPAGAADGSGAHGLSSSGEALVRSMHLHVITLGDSTAFGVSSRNLRFPKPYGPVFAETLARRFEAELRNAHKSHPAHTPTVSSHNHAAEGGSSANRSTQPPRGDDGPFWSNDVSLSWSSEVHAFPGFSSKKVVFGLRKLDTADLDSYLARQKRAHTTAEIDNWFSVIGPHDGASDGKDASPAPNGTVSHHPPIDAAGAEPSAASDHDGSSTAGSDLQKDLQLEEATEVRMGGNKFDGGIGVRAAGSPIGGGAGAGGGKKGGAQGYNRFMMQSDKDDDQDLVELTYESFFHRFAKRTVDARSLHLGLSDNFTKEQSTSFVSTSRRRPVAADTTIKREARPKVLVVVCNVLAGVNDAMMGIPWWWTSLNLRRLHDSCRDKVDLYIRQSASGVGETSSDAKDAECSMPPAPPKLTVVLTVPLRIIPPYHYLQEGMTAQTFRRAKRVLDPNGQCEFYFRSPRRKLNLYHMMDAMAWVALSSHRTYRHSRLLESYPSYVGSTSRRSSSSLTTSGSGTQGGGLTLWNPTASSNRWCRRPVACRGIPVAKDFSNSVEAKRYVSTSTKPCFAIPVTRQDGPTASASTTTTTLCYVTRRMIPIDKHFIFPDKLSNTMPWRMALSKWDDCLHPSSSGYHSMAEELAGKVSRDLMNVVRVMQAPHPSPETAADEVDKQHSGSGGGSGGDGASAVSLGEPSASTLFSGDADHAPQ